MVKEFGTPGHAAIKQLGKNGHQNGTLSSTKVDKFEVHYLNFGEEDQMEVHCYKSDNLKKIITWTFHVLTLGILRLVFHWYPKWELICTHSKTDLESAEKALITENYKGKYELSFVKNIETLEAKSENNNIRKTESVISINGLIFAKDNEDEKKLLTIYLCDGTKKQLTKIRVVRHKKLIYVWDDEKGKFTKLSGLDKGVTNAEFHSSKGLTQEEQTVRRIPYGSNEIIVPVQSIPTLLVLEALTPFYMFQLFSLLVWLSEAYYYYAIAIIFMSVFGISTSVIQTRRNQLNLKGTVHSTDKVSVCRDEFGVLEEIPTTELVPGDLILIPSHGCEMQCDAVLLNGSCIVNESMLTGESVPVMKTALPNNDQLYKSSEDANHTLYCGTKVIQTRFYGTENVLAVVTRTGYQTAKGELVRSILYPPPADFKFDQDSYKYITILAVIAIIGCLYTILSKSSRNIPTIDIIIKALDVITVAVPPALPAAMTVGKLYAVNRLRKRQIFCINSRVINVSGSVNCVCFDKTGTLTEDGLDMWGVVPIDDGKIEKPTRDTKNLPKESKLFQGMLTCHSLTLIDNELCGDPLDVKMFESTGWILEEPKLPDTSKYDLLVPTVVRPVENYIENNEIEIGLIHQYQFSSSLQRMSIICRRLGSEFFEIFCKGSPEMIISLSKPETVPTGITDKLKEYTQQGYRVIGMGTKRIVDVQFHKITKMHRHEVECDLEFVGLIVLENRLKPQTTGVIETLRKAGMKLVMITGDNMQTAISVARDCGIIESDHSIIDVVTSRPTKSKLATIKFQQSEITPNYPSNNNLKSDIESFPERRFQCVLSGKEWADVNKYFPELIPKIVTKGVVFARMSGMQKQQVIEELQNLGYYVAMCGDGANDCGALKAAHVGISLSEAESSVASPFTSREPNISCTTEVVKEGRAALVTSFGVFKFMLCYSLNQLVSVLILYAIDSNLTSLQFLFIDVCLALLFASFFGKTKAREKLYKKPPMTSIFSFIPLMSIVLYVVASTGFQVVAFYYIMTFDWFTPFVFNPDNTTSYSSYENYAIFTVSMFQYITLAVVFTKGKPYRKPIFTNLFYLFSLLVMTVICIYITLYPAFWLMDALELEIPPKFDGRFAILVISVINFVVCFLVEDFIVDFFLYKKIRPKFHNVDKSKRKYLKILQELKLDDSSWPDVGFTQGDFSAFDERRESRARNGMYNGGFDCGNDCEVTKF